MKNIYKNVQKKKIKIVEKESKEKQGEANFKQQGL